jgi:glycosyltransferase involved in cell wall biosynthesis
MKLSVVVPVYNEASIIEGSAKCMLADLSDHNSDFELVLVNNGSTDRTGEILASLTDDHLRIVTLEKNETFGGGVLAGLKAARGEYLAVNCADLQVDTKEMLRLYDLTREQGVDYCKGDRQLDYAQWQRRFISRVYRWMVLRLFCLDIRDINGYPIIMTREAYQRINPQLKSWTLHVELLYRARVTGCRMIEPAVRHGERIGGISHIDLRVIMKFFCGLLVYRLKTLWA